MTVCLCRCLRRVLASKTIECLPVFGNRFVVFRCIFQYTTQSGSLGLEANSNECVSRFSPFDTHTHSLLLLLSLSIRCKRLNIVDANRKEIQCKFNEMRSLSRSYWWQCAKLVHFGPMRKAREEREAHMHRVQHWSSTQMTQHIQFRGCW